MVRYRHRYLRCRGCGGGYFFLFPSFSSAISGFFADRVINVIESRHYPELTKVSSLSVISEMRLFFKTLSRLILFNILVLPLYLIPALNLFVYLILNGFLLGQEYGEMILLRRLEGSEARALVKKNRVSLLAFGLGLALMSIVPILNLFVPLLAPALFTHWGALTLRTKNLLESR